MALTWESLFASLFQLTLPAGKTGFANAEFAFKLSGVLAAAFQQLNCLSLELICVRSSALCHLSPSENDYTRSLSLCPLFRGKIMGDWKTRETNYEFANEANDTYSLERLVF